MNLYGKTIEQVNDELNAAADSLLKNNPKLIREEVVGLAGQYIYGLPCAPPEELELQMTPEVEEWLRDTKRQATTGAEN